VWHVVEMFVSTLHVVDVWHAVTSVEPNGAPHGVEHVDTKKKFPISVLQDFHGTVIHPARELGWSTWVLAEWKCDFNFDRAQDF